jgi:hypothetical protein
MCLAALLALWTVNSPPSRASTSASVCPPTGTDGSPFHESNDGPKGQPLPEQVVACVGSQAITGTTYRHWEVIARSGSASPKHQPSAQDLNSQVMGFLISADWVIGEANTLHIHVSTDAVRHKFADLRKQQFPKSSAFRTFLRKTHQTVRDLQLRVQLNLLSQLIQKHVTAHHRGSTEQQHVLSNFVRAFKIKWTAQTYCQAEYAIGDCGRVRNAV